MLYNDGSLLRSLINCDAGCFSTDGMPLRGMENQCECFIPQTGRSSGALNCFAGYFSTDGIPPPGQ